LALSDAGLPFDPMLVQVGTWYEDSGYRLMRDLLALPTPPDALFCASDAIAIGALDALHEAGLSAPHDVALVGFDNRVPAAHQRPPLTTVALPLYEMGVLAGELLLSAVGNETPPSAEIHKVPCYLVPRDST
jgi:LacI family transcriptional regulator